MRTSSNIAGMSIDPGTGQIYYMSASTTSALRRLDPGGAVITLATTIPGPSGGIYPFGSTDIQYFGGIVYMMDSGGHLQKFSSTVATASIFATIAGFSIEGGLAMVGNSLYATSGAAATSQIRAINLSTGLVSTPAPALSLPIRPQSLEYDLVNNRLIVFESNGASSGFHTISLSTGAMGPLFGASVAGVGNFAIDPTGTSIFARNGSVLNQINIATGAVTAFYNGLSTGAGSDAVFGPSSAGPGQSLYIANGTSIEEVSGFPATPVPEPGTALVGLALLGLSAIRRRRRA